MAQIREEIVIIKVSTLVKNDADAGVNVFTDEVTAFLEDAVAQVVGDKGVVEVIKE